MILMGIAPLSAWGTSMAKRLARAIWKPSAVSLLVPIFVFATGTRNWIALLAFWLSAFVACVTLYEYGRGILARHKTTGESLPVAFWRLGAKNRRRYGGYIIHLGVVLMALGVIGIELYQTETQGLIKPGESLKLGEYTVTLGLKKPGEYKNPADLPLKIWDTTDGTNMNIARAEMAVYRKGQFVTMLYPRRDYYYESQQPMTIPGLRSSPEDDIYVILVDWQPITANGATFKVFHNPLVYWMWMGAFVFILGAGVAAWPEQEPELQRVKVARPASVLTEV
jgi:cytochrome c-type biogenesis protein CcmF